MKSYIIKFNFILFISIGICYMIAVRIPITKYYISSPEVPKYEVSIKHLNEIKEPYNIDYLIIEEHFNWKIAVSFFLLIFNTLLIAISFNELYQGKVKKKDNKK